jgi:hypothetical protein
MIFNSFEFDVEFAGKLYDLIEIELEATRSDAQGLVEANTDEIENLYKEGKTVEEIISIVWPL